MGLRVYGLPTSCASSYTCDAGAEALNRVYRPDDDIMIMT